MWTSTMTNRITPKHQIIDHGYKCDKCGSKGDVFDLGILLCGVCYLLKYDPSRVDKVKRKII